MIVRPRLSRLAALLVVGLWIAALFAPARQLSYGYGPLPRDTPIDAWSLAAFGWLGPLAASVAWYANPTLVFIVVRLAMGRSSGLRLPLVALALAATAFLPAFVYDFEQDGRFHPTLTRGLAVWLWIGAFVVAAAASLIKAAPPSPQAPADRHPAGS